MLQTLAYREGGSHTELYQGAGALLMEVYGQESL